MENSKKIFQYNGKEFIFVNKYVDEKYGEIIKAVTTKLDNFERLYFRNENGKLAIIQEKETLKDIYEKYEKIESDIVISSDEFSR